MRNTTTDIPTVHTIMHHHQPNETLNNTLQDESDVNKSEEAVLTCPPQTNLLLSSENSSSFDSSFGSIEESSTQHDHVCDEAAIATTHIPFPSTPANSVPILPLAALQIRSSLVRPLVIPRESNIPLSNLVDNSSRIYYPFRLKCGVTVQVGEHVLDASPNLLDQLNLDLVCCLHVLPASVRWLVRRTKIWVNRTYVYEFVSLVSYVFFHHVLNCNIHLIATLTVR